jgi:hypothetical protein
MRSVEVVHTPAGCTYLYQPINLGIDKLIKSQLWDKWEQLMIEGEGIVDGKVKSGWFMFTTIFQKGLEKCMTEDGF